jgi:GNAT superfamily N-acetyltransferase
LTTKYGAHNTYISTLKESHTDILDSFESEGKDQNDFLVKDAIEYSKLNLGVTYLLFNAATDSLVSFITLGTGAIKIPEKMRGDWKLRGRRLVDYPKDFPYQFPALKIGQLATQKDEQGKGAASLLLTFAVRKAIMELQPVVGCKYLIADAYPERVPWYEKNGFIIIRKGKKTFAVLFELP